MKGEKGIPGVTVGEGLGEELTDESFCKCLLFVVNICVLRLIFIPLKLKTLLFFCGVLGQLAFIELPYCQLLSGFPVNHNFQPKFSNYSK